MGTPEKEKNDVFDVRRIRRLVELMQDNDLAEIDLQQGDMRIQMKRNTSQLPPAIASSFPVPAFAPAPVGLGASGDAVPKSPSPDDSNHTYITSPMVGTFYTSPDPESPPYVKIGDVVHPEKTVCILEAMKVFNEIQAEVSGKIVAILVLNGEPVEFGKPLFKVETSGK